MIISCNIAIYYRLIIYSNTEDVLFGQKAVARETMMLASEMKKSFGGQAELLKDSVGDDKTKSLCINGSRWVGSRVLC